MFRTMAGMTEWFDIQGPVVDVRMVKFDSGVLFGDPAFDTNVRPNMAAPPENITIRSGKFALSLFFG